MRLIATIYAAIFVAVCLPFTVLAEEIPDAMAPEGSKEEALVLPLNTVTIATTSLQESKLFYVEGLGLEMTGPIAVEESVKAQQRALWGIEGALDWQLYLLRRPGPRDADNLMQIQLLVLDRPQAAIHNKWGAMELGPFSIGFPNTDQITLDKHMRKLGYGSLNVTEIYQVPRPDGALYDINETIYTGPDFVHAVGIYRGNGMPQLAPIDEASGMGGPGYSAQVLDDSEKTLAFYTDVLGYEIRSDRTWKSAGSKGALNVPDGTIFRFAILFAKGYGPGGHLLFIDYENREADSPAVPPRLPHRGIGMWSFETKDLDQVLAKAQEAGTPMVHSPMSYNNPALGPVRAATMLAPNGFLIEVFETIEE